MYFSKLATKDDVQNFVYGISPHVKKVIVEDKWDDPDSEYDVLITIHLTWLYGLFYKEIFFNFIDPQIQERALLGLNYKVVVKSLFA